MALGPRTLLKEIHHGGVLAAPAGRVIPAPSATSPHAAPC